MHALYGLCAAVAGLSVKVMSWVWDHSKSRGAQRLVLLAIADHANDDGLDAYPSVTRLARKTGMTERGVRKAIDALIALGELHKSDDNKGGRGIVNRYRVLMTTSDSVETMNVVPAIDENPEPETLNQKPGTTNTESDSGNDVQGLAPETLNVATQNPERRSAEPSITKEQPPLVIPFGDNHPPKAKIAKPRGDPLDRDPDFVEFWSTYPRREAKGAARKAWITAIKKAEPKTIIDGARRYRDDPRRKPDYTAHPATWLNQERWKDEINIRPSQPDYSPWRN